MRSEDYIYMLSQLSSDKIPQHIRDKIDKGEEFTEDEE